MTRRARAAHRFTRLAVVLPFAIACAQTAQKTGDSAGATDSAAPATPGAMTPVPATPTDSTPKNPSPSGSTTSSAPSPTPAATPAVSPSETVLTGRVTVGGLASDQRTALQIEGGPTTTLTGPLEPELRTLNSATVWVAGGPVSGPPNASFAVSRYEIVAIDGAKPVVGVLTSRDGATWVAMERDTVKLAATTAELRAKVGAKVWIVGRRTGSELTPQSFGVIREP